jgi:hypothetical protein
MSRPNVVPLNNTDITRIEAEARRMRAEFLTGAFRRLFARLRGVAVAPTRPARA